MPLLGRHKSLPGGNQSGQKQSPPALVCESPLFGTRCQLPSSSTSQKQQQQQQQATSSSKQTLSKHQSWSTGSGGAGKRSPPANETSGSTGAETLGSIPKQITRQQIHYAFSIMDTNTDGLIDLRDLSQMLANLGVPIDEAILSHVMSSVSKRGDHRISEAEFLDWIGNFIQVSECEPASNSPAGQRLAGGSPAASRSSSSPMAAGSPKDANVARSSSSALLAQSAEAQQAIELQRRQRRGSGSGLALMRSLSSSGAGSQDDRKQQQQKLELGGEPEARRRTTLAAEQQQEACDDLKAAFCVFDLDGDGFITIDEVQQGLKLLGESWSLAELNQLLFSKCEPRPAAAGKRTTAKSRPAQKQRISIDDFVKLLL